MFQTYVFCLLCYIVLACTVEAVWGCLGRGALNQLMNYSSVCRAAPSKASGSAKYPVDCHDGQFGWKRGTWKKQNSKSLQYVLTLPILLHRQSKKSGFFLDLFSCRSSPFFISFYVKFLLKTKGLLGDKNMPKTHFA